MALFSQLILAMMVNFCLLVLETTPLVFGPLTAPNQFLHLQIKNIQLQQD